jgi:hypothetical protein
MAPDVRVKAATRQGEQSDEEEPADSDEEWVDSSAESSSTGSATSKQRRSDASDRLQTTQSGEQPVVGALPPEKTEFDSWGALDVYRKSYLAETYQVTFAVLKMATEAVSHVLTCLLVPLLHPELPRSH